MPNPPPATTPAERFAMLILWLGNAVNAQGLVGRLAMPLVVLILNRLRSIKQSFARIAARVAAGRYAPRRFTPRPQAGPRPRAKNPLPHGEAWLLKLAPQATAAYASQLRFLLADQEMLALLAAAPASLGRPLRSLCRMLGVELPPIVAPPVRARPKTPKPKPERPAAPKRREKPEKVRYVFGLRYPPPFPDPV